MAQELTEPQYQLFMLEVREHHQRVEAFAQQQAENAGKVVELLAQSLKPDVRGSYAVTILSGMLASETSDNFYTNSEEVAIRKADRLIAALNDKG